MSTEEILDFRGEQCPGPIIKTIRKLTSISSGCVLVIYTDVEECVELIKNTLELMEFKSFSINREKNYWIIRIEK